ncbi:MAG TPA: type I restriction endonuclease subunit R [Pyrinomonadaceae bacterium]
MATHRFTENDVEDAGLSWLDELHFSVLPGAQIAPGEPAAERASLSESILPERLGASLVALNSAVAAESLDEVFRKLTLPESASLINNNRSLHRSLVDGIAVECRRDDGSTGAEIVRIIDFDDPVANDWLAVNQFTVIEGERNRRPDVVIFVNGLPLAVVELKNAADQDATLWNAFNQIQTYKLQIPSLFLHNAVNVISDGLEARVGTISADKERYMPWRTIEGETLAPVFLTELEVLLRGVFDKRRFLDLIRHFIVFEEDTSDGTIIKKMAGYHQFHAVNTAIEQTIKASRPNGTRQAGVVWHTQGSGKSLTMVFYAGRLVLHPAMENPTIVVLTDRNDLDEQLFGTFSRCRDLLRQTPVQATSREDLQTKLRVQSGGIVFTTIQKFFPEEKRGVYPMLSDRRNIVVIADEAHRSQYDFIDGFARHMHDALPNASFIGFTGTPIELKDANTRAVFGDYISIYDIQRAVEDKATVPIYYEGRLAKLGLDEKEKPRIDPDFEEATEGEEVEHKEKLKTKWAALEAVVGADKRLRLIADDLVRHWEARLDVMDGKAMIVCMSRRICFELYEAIRRLRPDWHDDDDSKGVMKIVMTGAAPDPLAWQPHIRTKKVRENLAKRFKNPNDPFKVVIVRDMWLTGFDVPCLHTMYIDKPMRGHGLMQAIARVNRVFRDKPGGLVVDYLGLAQDLKKALAVYTESGGKGRTAVDQEEAVEVMLEKYEVCCVLFHGFDWSLWTTGTPAQKLSLLPLAQEHILKEAEGKERLLRSVNELSLAFALAVPHAEAIRIRDDVGFFQAVRSAIAKETFERRGTVEEMNHAIRQIISRAISSDEVLDIFAAAGLKKPDISILSDEFLGEVRGMPQKNLAVELLRKLLTEEIKVRSRRNLVQSRLFSELLQKAILKYQNRAIETAAVIEELVGLARDMREAAKRGEALHLTDDEVAFYDALEVNDSAVKVLGDENLRIIARELVDTVRRNVTIDWTAREAVRARLRTMVKRILRRHGYPPDKQEKATQTVLEQAELICKDWVM